MQKLSFLDKPKSVDVHQHPEVHQTLPRHEVRNRRRREVRTLPTAGKPTTTGTRPAHPVPNRVTIEDPAAL